jgi:hypothetical protein
MQATPECWTTQKLTEAEINGICNWLMAWQKACVSSDAVASDFVEKADELPSQKLDPAFKTAMKHVESLIRHIGAINSKGEP